MFLYLQVVARDGGQLESTSWVDNYPGYEEGVDAVELVQRLQKQVCRIASVAPVFIGAARASTSLVFVS